MLLTTLLVVCHRGHEAIGADLSGRLLGGMETTGDGDTISAAVASAVAGRDACDGLTLIGK